MNCDDCIRRDWSPAFYVFTCWELYNSVTTAMLLTAFYREAYGDLSSLYN